MICVKDIIKLDIFKNIELISGSHGLSRRVIWPNIVQTENFSENLIGGDVIIIYGSGIDCGIYSICQLIMQALEKNAACMIILKNVQYLYQLSTEAKALSEEEKFPIFFAPGNIKTCHLIKEIATLYFNDQHSEQYMKEFLVSLLLNTIDYKNETNQERLREYNLFGPHRVIFIHLESGCTTIDEDNRIQSDSIHQFVLFRFFSLFREYFSPLHFVRKSGDWIYLVDGKYTIDDMKEQCNVILKRLDGTWKNHGIVVGIGRVYNNPKEYHISFNEAKMMAKMQKGKTVRFVEDIGLFSFFIDTDKLDSMKKFARKVLSPIEIYDKHHSSNLLLTLHTLLAHDMAITESAKTLFIHKNTLQRRVIKIEELLGMSIKMVETKNHLYNCFKVLDLY